jgi:UDP-2,3-diacylglucosamine pyrophosphatase LpxH
VLPFAIGNLQIVKDYIYESNGKKYWVVHGDIFDSITSNMKWLAHLGDVGYTLLLWINKVYNNWRMKRGLPYYSLSKEIKAKVKSAVSYISDYEKELVSLAHSRHFNGVICGHIHQPAIQQYDDVLYLNSGDWVETLSALVEDEQGSWQIVYYSDFVKNEKDEE